MTGAPKRRASPEAAIQRAIIDRLRWHGVLVVSVPNEGRRSTREGYRLKQNGMRPGFPDLIAMQRGLVAFLECKAPGGRLSEAQAEFHRELERHGMAVATVRSQDEAIEFLRGEGFDV